ncbi:MAG: hypothetical protein KC613_07405 [Myxococcales bacterium]|nr:hypothetical protein [Myxococcales bacterium]MCB9523942.1 hypothetical protein [Myxococcales bacterium]
MEYRQGAGAEVQIRPPDGPPGPVDGVDGLLRALPVGRDVPVKVPGLLWLYATGEAGPGLAAFVEGLLARATGLRHRLMGGPASPTMWPDGSLTVAVRTWGHQHPDLGAHDASRPLEAVGPDRGPGRERPGPRHAPPAA